MHRPLIMFFALAAVSGSATAARADAPWLGTWDKAAKLAKQSGRPVLALFTGSDWCPPCHMLESEIFRSPVFESWAKQHVVLLRLDFPHYHAQPEAVQAANRGLSAQYGVGAFPTVLFLSPTGQVLGRQQGFNGGGPTFWTKNAEIVIRAGMQRAGS